MQVDSSTSSLGSQMIYAAHLAVEMHMLLARDESRSRHQLRQQAMIGGTDRYVTDDAQSIAGWDENQIEPSKRF